MRLTRINIDNFGPFANREFNNISEHLTLINGPNETGKSAIRAFIRSTLFGYVNKTDRVPLREIFQYKHIKPEAGSGSISITTSNNNQFEVHRREGKKRGEVSITGKTNGDEYLLQMLISDIDIELYTNVFSISLSELQVFSSLNSNEIQDKIYSVGLGLTNLSLTDVRAKINGELRELRSPRAGRIRTIEKELLEARGLLQETRLNGEQYSDLSKQIEKVREDIDSKTADLAQIRSNIEHQKTLINLRNPWSRKIELDRQITELPKIDVIPDDALQQLEGLIERKNNFVEQVNDGNLRQQKRNNELSSINVIDSFNTHGNEIRKLLMQAGHYTKAVDDLPVVQKELDKEQASFDFEVANLGWTKEAIETFDESIEHQSNLQTVGSKLSTAQQKHQEAKLIFEARSEDQESVSNHVIKLETKRDALGKVSTKTSTDIEQTRDRLSRLRAAIADATSTRSEMNEAQQTLDHNQKYSDQKQEIFASILFPSVVIIISAALIVWYQTMGELSGSLAAILGVLILCAGLLLVSRVNKTKLIKNNNENIPANGSTSLSNAQIEEIHNRFLAVNREVSEIAQEFNISEPPSIRDVEEKTGEIERSLDLRRKFESISNDAEAAIAQLASSNSRLTESRKMLELRSKTLNELKLQWQKLLKHSNLSVDLNPSQAVNFIGSVRTLKIQIKNINSLKIRLSQMYETVEQIDGRLLKVLNAAGLPNAPAHQGSQALEDLSNRMLKHERAIEHKKQIADQVMIWEKELETLTSKISDIESMTLALFNKGNTDSQEEFIKIAIQVGKRRELERKLFELVENSPLLNSADGQSYRESLSNVTHEEVIAKRQQLEDDARRISVVINELHIKEGNLRNQLVEHEKSNKPLELQTKINILKEQLNRQAERWAVLTIAHDMFEKTREEFQKERQPDLIKSASKHLSELTLGRYTSVRAVIGEKDQDLEVIESTGTTKLANELSRGTAEQLFLAMRFALIEEYSQNAEPVPIILDDILVNFDPRRAQAACKVIMKLSQKFQIIFLTCHPETEAMFMSALSGTDKLSKSAISIIDLNKNTSPDQLKLVEPT